MRRGFWIAKGVKILVIVAVVLGVRELRGDEPVELARARALRRRRCSITGRRSGLLVLARLAVRRPAAARPRALGPFDGIMSARTGSR